MVFAEEELELVTGGADGKFLVWQMPSLVLKQRFTRLKASPLVSEAREQTERLSASISSSTDHF